jgi:NitT/TauT family transport system substrate-binding protein
MFPMPIIQTRRRFLTTLSLAGAAGLVRARPALAAEGPLETTTVRFGKITPICIAPQYVGEELLRAEGFTDISYLDLADPDQSEAVARGKIDFASDFVGETIGAIDAGKTMVVLAGVHVGCVELFAKRNIRSIMELKGKSVGLKASPPNLLTLMTAQVGLDPVKDIRWVTSTDPSVNPLELFVEGRIDAFLGFPPEPQELRARHAGHVIVSTAVDRPWSQYFCCMLAGNQDYVRKHPVATKRVLRAVLKAADLCGTEPARSARRLVDGGFTDRYDYAFETLSEVPYDKWREYDAEDTIRFYALRMREAGFIKSNPQKIIADGTDWRFLDELKRELKA